MANEHSRVPESLQVVGSQTIDTVQRLIHEGNVRRIIIKHNGHSIIEVPLTVGVVGAALAPPLAAIGAIAALVAECTVEVERDDLPNVPPDGGAN